MQSNNLGLKEKHIKKLYLYPQRLCSGEKEEKELQVDAIEF